MKKYKQTIIPEISTDNWENLTPQESRKKLLEYYRTKYPYNRTIINQHLGIKIGFEADGVSKTCRGGKIYPEKNCLIEILDKLIRYAEFNNFGNRKPTDKPNVLGYLNFKAKAKVNGQIEYVHLTIRISNRKEGRFTFHYSMSINIWNKKSR
ncbi:MAG: hypothetical protein FWG79_09645 [Bacteroidales bacterium]|nr:hypothetical protein [Bacteroidales bacterium]